jgi:FAD/FMN-containing dehydrogenase
LRQLDPKGPAQTDFLRLLTGAQGSMGIVTWASIKCELAPDLRKFFFVPSDALESLIDFSYRLQRLRLGDEVMLVNNAELAYLLGKDVDEVRGLKENLPSWTVVIGVAGRALLPEERVAVQEKDLADLAQQFGLKLLYGIGGASGKLVAQTLLSPSREPFWKSAYRGGFQDIFFQTTLDRATEFIDVMRSVAARHHFPFSEIGIYIQPQHQGAAHHIEFNLPYCPQREKEAVELKDLYAKASEALIARGAYFARPYGIWADMVYERDANSSTALKKIKRVFDPNQVLNPGKLCF